MRLNEFAPNKQGVAEGTESQYMAARYIDEFGDGDHWYVKGTPDVIKKFVLLANSLEDEAVKGTEYEPGKGMMSGVHAELGNDAAPQWTVVPARNLESIKPIGDKVLQRLMRPNLADGAQEFMSELLWAMEAKGLALVTDDSQQGVAEGKFRSKDIEEFIPPDDKLDDFKSKYLPDWEMLDHRTLQAKYVAKDHRHAQEFTAWINNLCEKMDHFAEVTQDVAEVTVKTTTFDVKGLTILDFKLAMAVDKYAESNDIEQVRMSGNFGMHQ